MHRGARHRILHIDGDSFFASCEVALHPQWAGRPVWVGGGRRGDGIVIAANREAKRFGIATGMACFEALRRCPNGVLAKPHYDEYRRLSCEMFRIFEEYTPTLVPASIDEGFLDFTGMEKHVWRHTTAADYVNGIREHVRQKIGLPVSAGLANSPRLAKLATDVGKPGFLEIPEGQEKEFLSGHSVREMSGVGARRERSLQALGALTFGDVAKLPSTLLRQKFGIWGQQLWLFANGKWSEPLLLEVKDRTTISSSTTLPYDERDASAVLTFVCSEATRLVGQLRREQLQAREISLAIRFNDFTEVASSHRFRTAQFRNSVFNGALEGMFGDLMWHAVKPVRQVRLAMWNLSPLDTSPTLWGTNDAERWAALDSASQRLQSRFGKPAVFTGAQLALKRLDESYSQPKSKCPFVPAREMALSLWGDAVRGD
ncbi:MAG: DNA polymerase IV [Pedosphaera sp.]|nr:DNA polymerase IV [Pedosphaera sp.]